MNCEQELLQKLKVAVEFSRQHYYLPQDVLDVFYILVPESIEFNREGFLKEVFGEDYQDIEEE